MSGFIATNPYPVLRCERCGRALAAADSLCDCDAADEASLAAASAAGTTSMPTSASAAAARVATTSSAVASSAATPSATAVDRANANAEIHICPACGGRFGWRGLRVFHSTQGIPWYRFARFGKACPHCTTPLRSRHPLGWPQRALPAVIMAFILSSHLFGLMPPYENWLRMGLWFAFLLQRLDNHRRESRDPLAYERDPRWP